MTPFFPTGPTVNIDVSASSAEVLVTTQVEPDRQLRVMNNGSATVWINFGTDSSVTASLSTGIPIPAGAIEVYTGEKKPTYVAAIAAASTGKIYFTPGRGL